MDHFFRGWQLILLLLSALQILPQCGTWMTSPSPTNIRWFDFIEWGLWDAALLLCWADLPVIMKNLQLFTVSFFAGVILMIVACCATKLSWKKANLFVPLKKNKANKWKRSLKIASNASVISKSVGGTVFSWPSLRFLWISSKCTGRSNKQP